MAILTLAAMGCAGTAKVDRATSQVWHGGAAGSGGGKNYKVYVSKSSSLPLEISQVWIGDRDKGWLADFRVVYDGLANGNRNHGAPKGVTSFTVEFQEITPGGPNPRGEGRPVAVKPFDNPPSDLPTEYQHGAAIYYTAGKTKGIWVVTEMEILEPLFYP